MAGISTEYKNTQDSPNASIYDELRVLNKDILKKRFLEYLQVYLENIKLKINNKKINLKLKSIDVPIVGYKSVPRISTLRLNAKLIENPEVVFWQYHKNYGDNAFRYRIEKKNKYTWNEWMWLRNNASSGDIIIKQQKTKSTFETIWQFIVIGYSHIIPLGLDHILFIIGIALLSFSFRKLLLLVSFFTLAHSVTLGLAIYGLIYLPPEVVEPLIALSIFYIGIENLFLKLNIKFRAIIVFLFGLLHGLGFATVLADFEMQIDSFMTSLISFNIGVEFGQISVILLLLFLMKTIMFINIKYHNYATKIISILIAVIGFIWTIERLIR